MKHPNGTINKETYKVLKQKLPIDPATGKVITYKVWKEIVSTANKQIVQQVIEDPRGFVFPNLYLGMLQVGKSKPRKQPVNILESKKAGEPRRYSNLDTFKYVFKIKWTNAKFGMFRIYKFKPCRQNFKHLLAARIKSGKQNYFNSDY